MPRRVLIIAYQFPPVGGAGVQRAVKFVKYLPRHGWSASVLTVANPSVPVLDQSLGGDVPAATVIRRGRTLEPGYALKSVVSAGGRSTAGGNGNGNVAAGEGGGIRRRGARVARDAARRVAAFVLQPDPQVLWLPGALREGLRLCREVRHDAIFVTAPPFSAFLLGAALSRRTGLPLVLDYRDEWTLSSAYWENKRLDPLSLRLQERMQRAVVRRASALVATTRSSAQALNAIRSEARSTARVECIYNGFDPDDFALLSPPSPSVPRADAAGSGGGRYRLAYIGTLWNLTSLAPLVEAVQKLAARSPLLVEQLEFVFAGRRTGQQQELVELLKRSPCRVIEHPYLDHAGAVELMRSADGLCVLLSDVPGAERVVPAKVFECMAARKPVLAIAPKGEVWELLEGYPAAHRLEPKDVDGIADCLAHEVRRRLDGRVPELNGWSADRFERRTQARQLANLLSAVADGRAHARVGAAEVP